MVSISPRDVRESGCPVHFLWDGRGRGRWPVRLGFLGLLAAGGVFAGARSFGWALESVGLAIAVVAALTWLAGQGMGLARR